MSEFIETSTRRRLRDRRGRMLAVFVAASVALHVAVFAGLPLLSIEAAAPTATVLDVVLISAPPAAPLPVHTPETPAGKHLVPGKPMPRERAALPRAKPGPAKPPAPVPEAPPVTAAEPAPPAPAVAPRAHVNSAELARDAQSARKSVAPAPASAPSPGPLPAAEPVTPPQFNVAYLRNPPPRYPMIARRRGEEGTVTLRVHVRRDGMPSAVTVEKSSGFEALDDAAVEAVRGWRFAPARRGEERIDAWVLVPVVFRLEGMS